MGVPEIRVEELKRRLDAGENLFLLDVRDEFEFEISNIGGQLIPLAELPKRMNELDANLNIVTVCKMGPRGVKAAQVLQDLIAVSLPIRPTAEFTARCRATMLGLAVERFRNLHNGALPAKLEELTPALIPEIPRDPFDDQPMRYQKLERGFCVYSVGPNGKDDGGDGTLSYPLPRTKIDDITFSVQNR